VADAGRVRARAEVHVSFAGCIEANHPRSKAEWVTLYRQTFRFTGGEIVGEFLMSIGILPGAHLPSCPVYPRILRQRPLWARSRKAAARKTDGLGAGRAERALVTRVC